jgi:adenylosuccinate lyase
LTNGLFFSQRVLIELTLFGFTREQAYELVQKHAMHSWNSGTSFYKNVSADPKINKKLPVNKLKKLFDFSYHTKRINLIFNRSLKK